MSASAEFTDYVLEQLEPAGAVRTTRFFGGVGICTGATQFAMIMGNSLYFVVDDSTRPKYERAGMRPFSYRTRHGIREVRRYFELPEEVLTDPHELRVWMRESIDIASRRPATKRRRRPASKRVVKRRIRRNG
ncbi:MAG: TfoX/Sxy family protein [Gammaproteobacteria bacterium]